MKLESISRVLFGKICELVEDARTFVANTTNKSITILYWKIGSLINNELLNGNRAEYGKQIVSLLATELQAQYGKRGFQERNICRMMQFSELFPNFEIVSS